MPDKLLIVDDEPKVRGLLRAALSRTYDVTEAESGEEALRLARTGEFRLVLLDLMMPGMDGYEVCQRLRRNPLTCHMTVVMLTAKNTERDLVFGLRTGADDYIVKPFKISELKARIESHLRRQWRELQASPLTGLPGNAQIDQIIKACLVDTTPFAVCYADLNNFKAYNDRYGFPAGDKVLQYSGRLLTQTVGSLGDPDSDFVGHVGGDDFVIIAAQSRAEAICQSIVDRFDAEIPQFYSPDDVERGGFDSKDRQGHLQFVPLIAISISIVSISPGEYQHPAQVGQTAADIKHYLKNHSGGKSSYLINRRTRSEG